MTLSVPDTPLGTPIQGNHPEQSFLPCDNHMVTAAVGVEFTQESSQGPGTAPVT